MNKINILDSSIFNRIAAGEVVEKPYSVVKELLDNSIDAKANKIEISIKDGGITFIKVADNGCGIEPDDFDRVFLPHSTSKIKTLEDLNSIGTLGFRGEALASISSVAKVTLKSKTSNCEFGKQMIIEGGITKETTDIGFDNGTTIIVENLFYNVPARAKFLRKPRQEATDITNLVARYILANPTISFRYFVDDKEVYFSTGNGLEDAIFVVYGKECLSNLIKVDYSHSSGINVQGYIGNTTYSKPNRTYQTLIINGRYIINSMVSTCVYNCYEHYLMKGQFPFYILNLNIPLDKLDVNVHPNKLDVRFENNNQIYGIVYTAVAESLNNSNTINVVEKPVFEYNIVNSGVSFKDNLDKFATPKIVEIKAENLVEIENKNDVQENNNSAMQTTMQSVEHTENSASSQYYANNEATNFYSSLSNLSSKSSFSQNSTIITNVYDAVLKSTNNQTLKQDSFVNNQIKFVGTLFLTYLLVENNNKVYIIDQHAAHERLLYDKLVEEVNNKNVVKQMLLVPIVLNVNSLESMFLDENKDNIEKLGFEFEEFGNLCYKITAVPAILKNADILSVFNGILKDVNIFKNIKQADLIIEKLMQSACKHAIKAGDSLTEENVLSLLNQMKDQQMLLQCPHGRPCIVELTRSELEKWFRRIV